ncbi:DNA polymerase kappa-like isoform X2 [Artemia franciscana]|uniref:DNA polymerase kappa n=1 Tax=Artemia franciscana TaxID=6661 RepID=A0AA88LBR5_ARTSF|nr:hypothetical protein QYM36_010220 [Artemia franciscana]
MAGCNTISINATKAGMEGIDKEKINKIIEEASKGSKFYLHKEKSQMDKLISTLESVRDLSHAIIHIDMDAFYAAVEMRDNPELKNRPMAVGGEGMLSTSNYHARRFGVRAGMPGFIGRKLCPELVIVPCNFDKYTATSKVVQGIFSQYDKSYCMMSLDEGYLDLTNYLDNLEEADGEKPDVEEVVNELRRKVFEATELTCSAGIGCNTRLAKIGSDQNKPNGQFVIPADKEEILKFIHDLPIRKISGIGNVTEQLLNSVGVVTCSDLFEKRGMLSLLFSEISCHQFMEIALGLGCTDLNEYNVSERKSISTETTFKATSNQEEIHKILEELCEELSEDMKNKCLFGKQFTLKCKLDTFDTLTRQTNLAFCTNDSSIMLKTAKVLLEKEISKLNSFCVRLLGVRMSELLSDQETKKQVTIDHFLTAKKENSDVCPVCLKEIAYWTVSEFAHHVNKCIDTENGETSSESKVNSDTKISKENILKESEPLYNRHDRDEICTSKKRKLTTIPEMFKKKKVEKIVTCPVCNVWTVDECKSYELNQHIDSCLI